MFKTFIVRKIFSFANSELTVSPIFLSKSLKGTFLSMTAIEGILETFENSYLDLFPLEDVFFTGILRAKADLGSPKDHAGICEHLGELWFWIKSLKF